MSLNDKNQKCAVCSAYLFPEDDIVYCPVCGAPHHRDCYMHFERCGLEEFHGTDKEYRREVNEEEPQEVKPGPKNPAHSGGVCLGCGMNLEEGLPYCTNCGMPSGATPFGMPPFEPINKNAVIEDGVTVGDAANVVRNNSFRYIPKFLKLNSANKSSWNWAAFLLPNGWFAFRKMYKESIITTILMITSTVLFFPFTLAIDSLPLADESIKNYVQLGEYYAQFLGEIGVLPLLLSFFGLVLSLVIRIVSGIYGDYIYRQRVVQSCILIKQAEDKEAATKKHSGTSFIGFFLAVLAIEFIPSLLSIFLM